MKPTGAKRRTPSNDSTAPGIRSQTHPLATPLFSFDIQVSTPDVYFSPLTLRRPIRSNAFSDPQNPLLHKQCTA